MSEKSYFISILYQIIQKFQFWYKSSMLCRIAEAVIKAVMGSWSKSTIRKLLFNDYNFEKKLSNSAIGSFFTKLSAGFENNSPKFQRLFGGSAFLSYFASVCSGLLTNGIRGYGISLVSFGLLTAAGKAALSVYGSFYYAGIALAVLGAVLILIDKPLTSLYNGSWLCRFIGGLFLLDELKEKPFEKRHYLFFALAGVYFACCAVFLSPLYFIMASGGFVGAVLVLYRTEIGVLATAFLIPLVPTKIILGLTALTVVSYLFHVLAGRLKFKFRLLDLFVLFFALLLAYSVIISFRPLGSAPQVAVYILFIAFYVAAKNTLVSRNQVYAAVSLIIASGFLVSAIGILQDLTGAFESRTMWLDSSMFEDVSGRVYSTLENPNVLGEYLIIIIALTTAAIYYIKEPVYKLVAFGVLMVSGYCMVLTLSRGAWLGLLLAFAVFILLNDRRLIWLAVIGLILAPLIIPDSILNRFLSIGNIQDTSTNYRVNIWLASLLLLKVFWPVGIGLGYQSFVFIYSRFAFNAVFAPHSHNLYLQIAIDLGFLGLLIFICYTAVYFKNMLLVQKKANDSFTKLIPGALCAAMAGYLLQGMTDYVWYNNRVVCLFWLLLALCGAVTEYARFETGTERNIGNIEMKEDK